MTRLSICAMEQMPLALRKPLHGTENKWELWINFHKAWKTYRPMPVTSPLNEKQCAAKARKPPNYLIYRFALCYLPLFPLIVNMIVNVFLRPESDTKADVGKSGTPGVYRYPFPPYLSGIITTGFEMSGNIVQWCRRSVQGMVSKRTILSIMWYVHLCLI